MIKSSSIILIFITIIVWLLYLFPEEAIAPGDLLEKHVQFEEQCSNCHDTFKGPSGEKCVQCHTPEKIGVLDVDNQVVKQAKKQLSFHAKLTADLCITCHKEHLGKTTSGRVVQFSHGMIGIGNTGKCADCHQKPMDVVHQPVSQDCMQCHKENNWSSSEIDHADYFKFDRDHKPDCSTCHPDADYSQYTCYGCHEHSLRKIERKHVKEGIPDYNDCADCHASGDEHDIRESRRVKKRRVEPADDEIKRHDKRSKRSSKHSSRSKRHKDNDDDEDDDDDHDDDEKDDH